jgi:hypothetical protein
MDINPNQNQSDTHSESNNSNNNSAYGPDFSLQSVIQEQREQRRQQQQQNKNNQSSNSVNNNGGITAAVVTDRTVRVFVKNIPNPLIEQFNDQALLNELQEASNGGVDRFTMFSDKTGRYTGQAMCTMKSAEAAEMAIQALNGKRFGNEDPLELEHAKDHGVVMSSRLRGIERDTRLAEQPWRRGDRFGRMYNEDGSLKAQYENHHFGAANNYGIGQGRGGGGGGSGSNSNKNFNRGGGAGRGGGSGSSNAGSAFYRGPATQGGLDGVLDNWNTNNNNNTNNDNNSN